MRGTKGRSQVAWYCIRRQTRGSRREGIIGRGPELCEVRNRKGTATVVVAARGRNLKLRIVRAGSVHRLAHAAGMLSRSGDRQSYRDKQAGEQQDKQKPGGQTLHESPVRHPTNTRTMPVRISQRRAARKRVSLVRTMGLRAVYFIRTQRPPLVKRITRFMTISIRS